MTPTVQISPRPWISKKGRAGAAARASASVGGIGAGGGGSPTTSGDSIRLATSSSSPVRRLALSQLSDSSCCYFQISCCCWWCRGPCCCCCHLGHRPAPIHFFLFVMKCVSAVQRYLLAHELGCCSLLAGTSFVVFMTLLPLVIDPSVLTFVLRLEPASCLTVYTAALSGTSNCSWSSCQQGCTVEIFKCYHVNVSYLLNDPVQAAHLMDQQIQALEASSSSSMASVPYELPRQQPARLYPNVVGCGYPPDVDCDQFFHHYGRPLAFETTFPCFISMTDPTVAVVSADLTDAARRLAVGFSPLLVCLTLAVYVSLRLRCRRRKRDADRLKGQSAVDMVEEQVRRIAESKRLLESRKQMWLQAFRQDRQPLPPPASVKKRHPPPPPSQSAVVVVSNQQQQLEEAVAGPSHRSPPPSPTMPTSLPAPLVATISATIHAPASEHPPPDTAAS